MTRLHAAAIVMATWILLAAAGCDIAGIAKLSGEEQQLHGGSPGAFRARWWNYYTRGVSYADDQRWNEAESDLREALVRKDKDKRRARAYGMHFLDYFPHRELGITYYHQDRNEEALRELEASLKTEKSAKAEYYLDLVRKELILKNNVDTHPPKVFISTPLQNELTSRVNLTVSGTACDDTYVKSLEVNGIAVRIDLAAKEIPFDVAVPLTAGTNIVRIVARDLSGKGTTLERTVQADWQGPLLSIDEPTEGRWPQAETLKLTGYAHDEAGIARIRVNGHDLPITGGTDIQLDHAISPGQHPDVVTVEATDTLGNTTHADIRLGPTAMGSRRLLLASLDTHSAQLCDAVGTAKAPTPLIIELRNLTDRQEVYLDQLYLEGSVRGEQEIQSFTVNGQPLLRKSARNIYFAHLAALNEGENLITIEATTATGNTAVRQVQVKRNLQKVAQVGSRLSAALLPIERKGAFGVFTEGLDDAILGELMGRSRFEMVERSRLEEILAEQKLGSSLLAAPDTAIRLGKILAANAMLFGSSVEKESGLEIYLRVVDVETSQILTAIDVYGEDLDHLAVKNLCRGLVLKLCDELPVTEGRVVEVKGERLFVNLGSNKHIKKGMRVIVYEEGVPIVDQLTGALIGSDSVELGQGVIRVVHDQMSEVKMIEKLLEEPIQPLHKVITR